MCTGVGEAGLRETASVQLRLQPTTYPTFVRPESMAADIAKRLGSPLKLKCPARGADMRNLTWTKDGQSVPESAKKNKWALHLGSVNQQTQGKYTCTICNTFGCIQHTFNVTIFGTYTYFSSTYLGLVGVLEEAYTKA